MKRWIALVIIACLLGGLALAEADTDVFTLWFEDGFSLDIPEGWVWYPVDAADAGNGMRYILGDGMVTETADGVESSGRYLYIQRQQAEGVTDYDSLKAAIDARGDCSRVQPLDIDGVDLHFAAFKMPAANVRGCATVLDGAVYLFLFEPQDDSQMLRLVNDIMNSIALAK